MCKNNGFSLVELLIVMVIIAVIVAILIPVSLSAKESARKTACASNLRQLAQAAIAYAQDNNSFLPPYTNILPEDFPTWEQDIATGSTVLGYPAANLLHAALYPYVKNQGIWFCPSDPYAGKNIYHWNTRHLYSSYRFIFRFRPLLSLSGKVVGLRSKHPIYIKPSACMIISDPNIWTKMGQRIGLLPDITGNGCEHFDGTNRAYLDGHIKWRPNE